MTFQGIAEVVSMCIGMIIGATAAALILDFRTNPMEEDPNDPIIVDLKDYH